MNTQTLGMLMIDCKGGLPQSDVKWENYVLVAARD